jgi:hypothetical protein
LTNGQTVSAHGLKTVECLRLSTKKKNPNHQALLGVRHCFGIGCSADWTGDEGNAWVQVNCGVLVADARLSETSKYISKCQRMTALFQRK